MNYEIIDILYRSRITLLDHLEAQGYDTARYRKFSPKEIGEMIKAGTPKANPLNTMAPALQMNLVRSDAKEGEPSECLVVYTVGKIKQKIQPFTNAIVSPEDESYDKTKTELIVITLEPIAANFHTIAAMFWMKEQIRVRYFQAAAIINNPLKHFLVPKHEKMPKEEEDEFLRSNYVKKHQLPFIRFHEDPIARMIGLMPGDIVKITRPSPTAGECIMYRVCVP